MSVGNNVCQCFYVCVCMRVYNIYFNTHSQAHIHI